MPQRQAGFPPWVLASAALSDRAGATQGDVRGGVLRRRGTGSLRRGTTQRDRKGSAMAWRIPGSQSRIAMKEKEALARRLIAQGLNNTQISAQLRCSTRFVRDVRSTMEREGEGSAAAS